MSTLERKREIRQRGSRGSVTERFNAKFERGGPNSCWEWHAQIDGGYGRFHVGGDVGQVRAHRFAWEQANGRAVAAGMVVMHSCDNRACVNPAHLSEGTNHDNVLDRERKGRGNQPRGERSGRAKITSADAAAIRNAGERGVSGAQLAAHYGITRSLVCQIQKRAIWRHV